MSHAIKKFQFDAHDYQAFSAKLQDDLIALKLLLKRPGFGVGQSTIGAEIEFYIIDEEATVLPINSYLVKNIPSKQLQKEISRFSIELNVSPQALSHKPFTQFEQEIASHWQQLNAVAATKQGKLVAIGILPTLEAELFTKNNQMMTRSYRYKALSNHLIKLRSQPFHIDIQGKESLQMDLEKVTIAGATTSYQLHWRVNPLEFADYFNTVQLITPILLGLSANSPMLFGRQLWDETRIALFEQATNCFVPQQNQWEHPSHVSFGEGWLREGVWELFAEAAAIYSPLLPICYDEENSIEMVKQGKIPRLSALRLHQGTRWMWNRAIYDPSAGGHLRIEIRPLPAGPSFLDQSANAAFLYGLVFSLKDQVRERIALLPFECAKYNFYQAAKHSINARILWPSLQKSTLVEYNLMDLAERLLPYVEAGLKALKIETSEIQRLMHVLQGRIAKRVNGAVWQKETLDHFRHQSSNKNACKQMIDCYLQHQQTEKSVHEWERLR